MIEKILSNIKTLRKSKGYSQAEVAKLIGVSQSAYSRFERGVTKLYEETVTSIAQAFEMSLVDVLTYPAKYANIKDILYEDLVREAEVIVQIRIKKSDLRILN
jgi:transcriptional regulator with XRE-family HTH domain